MFLGVAMLHKLSEQRNCHVNPCSILNVAVGLKLKQIALDRDNETS